MKVLYMQDPPYIDYLYDKEMGELIITDPSGNNLTFNLIERQGDSRTEIFVSRRGNEIIEGFDSEYAFVAQIKIPARQYVVTDTGEKDLTYGFTIYHTEALPFDDTDVELILWNFVPDNIPPSLPE